MVVAPTACLGVVIGAVGELAGQTELPRGVLARDVLFLAAADALVRALDDEVEQLVRLRGVVMGA